MRKIIVFMLLVVFGMAYIYFQGAAGAASTPFTTRYYTPAPPAISKDAERVPPGGSANLLKPLRRWLSVPRAPQTAPPDRTRDIFMPQLADSAFGEMPHTEDGSRLPKTRINSILLFLLAGWLAGWLMLRFRNELAYGFLVLSIVALLVFLPGIFEVQIDAARLGQLQRLLAAAFSGMGLMEFFSLVMGLLIGGSGGLRRPRTPRKTGRKLLDALRL